MSNQKREINKYLKLIRKRLLSVCSEDETDKVIESIQEETEDFIADHPSASIKEIQEFIMCDDQFLRQKFDDIDPEVFIRELKKANRIKKRTVVIIGISLIILCAAIINGLYNIKAVKDSSIAYYTEEIVDYGDIPSTDETDLTEYTSELFSESESVAE